MWTIETVATALGLSFAGDGGRVVRRPAHPEAAGPEDLALAMDPKYLPLLARSAARAAMTPANADWRALGLEAVIFAPRARYAMAGVTKLFAPASGATPGAHPTAVIDPTATVDASAAVSAFVVIEAGAAVGPDAALGAHVSIGAGARIGARSALRAGVRIGPGVVIGEDVLIHENTVIGADGFSFVTPEPGAVEAARAGGANPFAVEPAVWTRIYSLGSVIIGDKVEIGACVTIDRGTVADTHVGSGTKIDNQVQVGHNVRIGRNCLLCGQVGVAGSATIGDRVVLGGQVGVADHAKIGDDVLVMASSGVSGAVGSKQIVGGSPALPRDDAMRQQMALRRLPRLLDDVAAIKKRLSSPDAKG